MSLARAFVTGKVVKAPEKRFTQNDAAICAFTMNIDKNNETLLRVSAFGQLAETIATIVSVGDEVAVDGRLQVNTYKLPNGKDKKVFEISASNVEKISLNDSTQSSNVQNSENVVTFSEEVSSSDLIDEDEIPF